MIPGNINTALISGAEGEYQISRSLRFNSADSAYLSRTPASAGNRKTWTWAGWAKLSALTGTNSSGGGTLFHCRNGTGDDGITDFLINTDGTVVFTGGASTWLTTTQVLRDFSAWYHLVISVDTTAATASNRLRLYINGSQVTTFNVNVSPSQNFDLAINQAATHRIGGRPSFNQFFNGYLADIHFIDGQALTPSSFAETNATTGQWVPKAYTGSYGTNGFRLDFSDNSAATATTLGKDAAGSNNWTPNNFSVTAGAGNDSLVDSPTSYGTDTGAGGEVRGNYATWNPLNSTSTLSNGNLDSNGASNGAVATIPLVGANFYWEVTPTLAGIGPHVGVLDAARINASTLATGGTTDGVVYRNDGAIFRNTGGGWTTAQTGLATYTANDVIGITYNNSTNAIQFYKNGVSAGTAVTMTAGISYVPWVFQYGTSAYTANFGQRPFAYTAPSGFKALCDTNLPAPVVAKPSTVMDVKLYTGNGSTQTISGLGFSPDLVWIKERNAAADHALYDIVRGTQNRLESNTTDAAATSDNGLTAFNSDGFALGSLAQVNTNADTYVAWTWDAGTTTSSNVAGSITSSVRANASAGFSVVTYTGTAANATVGHGLGVAPAMIIAKSRNNTGGDSGIWVVYHKNLTSAAYFLYLNQTNGETLASSVWNSTAPTSTVFSIGTASGSGTLSDHVAYCFAPVAGYSSFGSYTGNGSADGPFVFLGFRPRWVLVKTSSGSTGWTILDSARNTSNITNLQLFSHDPAAELTSPAYFACDFLSNGFKLRTADAASNASGATYIYAAFAESPFAYSRAR